MARSILTPFAFSIGGNIITNNAIGTIPLIIKGIASQTANLFQLQASTGTVVGGFTAPVNNVSRLNLGGTDLSATLGITVHASGGVGQVIRGASGQTANLQEWQTSTPTTVTLISSSGNISTSAGITLTGANSPISLPTGGNGTSGQVIVSAGTGATPTWGVPTYPSTAQQLFLASPTSGSGTPTFRYISTSDFTQFASPSIGQALIAAPVTGGWSWQSILPISGGTLTGNLTLAAGTTSVSPLTFQSGTNLTTVTAGANEYDGTVFYQTSNTNPGRALKTQDYYYASSANYIVDFSGSAAAQSVLGASTRGITVAAGTTYEYELSMAVQHQFAIETGITGTFSIVNTVGATVAHISYVDYGSNTTGFTTATTMSSVRTTGNVTFSAAISSGSRYNIVKVKGLIRVTGSGTSKIYPALSTSAINQNTWTVQSGLIFKLTPIGNGTVTSVGTWA